MVLCFLVLGSMIKKISIALLLLLSIPGAYILYLCGTYIDETITSGSMYGLTIGDSKKTVYQELQKAVRSIEGKPQDVYISIKVTDEAAELLATRPDYTMLVPSFLHDVGYPRFATEDHWSFYFENSFFNVLSLKFCGENLCEIYRHRKYFELP